MNTRNCHNANFEQDVLYSKYFNKCKYTIFSERVVGGFLFVHYVIRFTTCNIDKKIVMHFRSYNLSIRQRIKMDAPNNTELNLDALCDLLEDDEEELVENNAPKDKVQDKIHTAGDSKKEKNTPEIPATQPR